MRRMKSGEIYLRLLSHVRPYWREFALAILGMVIVAATEPLLPALLKPLLDGAFVDKNPQVMRWVPLAIIALFVVRGFATYLASYAVSWVGNRLVMDLRSRMFDKLLSLPAPYYDDHSSGNLISKLTYDVMQVMAAATSVLTVLFKDSLAIVGLLAWMLWLNWKLTLLALLMAPVIVLVVRAIGIRLRNANRDVLRAMGDVTQVVQEAIEGHRVVKLFGGQHYEAQRFAEQTNHVRRYLMKQVAAFSASAPIIQFNAAVALAAIVYLATLQSSADQITVGAFVSFITAMLMLTAPLKHITDVNEQLQRGLAAAESVFDLLDRDAEPDRGTVAIGRARGEIRFEKVSFAYGDPQRLALDTVDLAVKPGETVALVGPSGAGKTTLANLVPRFYRPVRGRVLLDGHDIEQLTLASLRANIALVSQDVVLFNDTVAANIAYGAMNGAGEKEVVAAAAAAHAMEFIRELPQGLATLVGDNGVKLSGGQRQRLAIARALLKNAPVLMLDEATSALDTESERHVQAALETLMRGRTTLVIAHRLSTIEKADRIVVLDRGRIAETGGHAALLARGGLYARLYQIQFAAAGQGNSPGPRL